MTSLQAYTDESAAQTGSKRLFFCGYISTSENWVDFCVAWNAVLDQDSRIEYLHMVEAQNLRGQFKNWTQNQRDKKIDQLANVIEKFNLLSFEFSVDSQRYYEKANGKAPRGLAVPNFIATFHTIAGIARHITEDIGFSGPIDFIFDEQCGVSDDIDLFFLQMKKNLPDRANAAIRGKPSFSNDRQTLPLQAADMLAWHIRREHEFGSGLDETLAMADRLRNPNGHLMSHIDTATIDGWGEFFREQSEVSPPAASKTQWKQLKKLIRALEAAGLEPPFEELTARVDPKKKDPNGQIKAGRQSTPSQEDKKRGRKP